MSQNPNPPNPAVGAPASVTQAKPPHAQTGNLASPPASQDPLATSSPTPTPGSPSSQAPPTRPPDQPVLANPNQNPVPLSSRIEFNHYPGPYIYVGSDGVENLAFMCSHPTVRPADQAGAVMWVFDPILGMTCYREVPHENDRQDEGHYWKTIPIEAGV